MNTQNQAVTFECLITPSVQLLNFSSTLSICCDNSMPSLSVYNSVALITPEFCIYSI